MAALAGTGHAAGPWTMERVLDAARTSDPGLRAAQARGDADHAAAGAGTFALSPRVSAHASLLRSDDPALLFSSKLRQDRFTAGDFALDQLNQPDTQSMLEVGITIEQPIFNGGRELIAPFAAGHMRRAARAAESASVADRLLHAASTFVMALRAVRAASADSLALATATEGRRAAVERFANGQVAELDTLRASARYADVYASWLDARSVQETALFRLASVVGEPVAAADLVEPGFARSDVPELSAAHIEQRGELIAARGRAAAAGLQSAQAGLHLLPSINGRLSFDHYRPADEGDFERRWTLALVAELPLWDGTERFRTWNEARARSRAAHEDAERLARDLGAVAVDAHADVAIAAERVGAAERGLAASENALDFALGRYRSGLLSIGELLETQTEAARARARWVDARAVAMLSRYRYLHAIGALK